MGSSGKGLLLALALLPVLVSGCSIYRVPGSVADYYYLNPDKDLSAIGRVAIVELDNNSSYPEVSLDVTEALFQALQKKQLFGLTVVSQTDPQWRSLQFDIDSTYGLEQLVAVRNALKMRCDAVLIGTITGFQPYPHIAMGLRLKLVDLRDGQLLWALEQVWDGADKVTEYRIKNYFRSQMRSAAAPLNEAMVTVSSRKFFKFVAYEVAETL